MKQALRKKLPDYLVLLAVAAALIFIGIALTISATTAIQLTFGLIVLSITLLNSFVFTIREILYWASKRDNGKDAE